jgi:hypothetical protein
MNEKDRDNAPDDRPVNAMELLRRQDLSDKDKLTLLKDWQLDLTERMTATDENMNGTQDEGRLAEQLRDVARALNVLEEDSEPPGH